MSLIEQAEQIIRENHNKPNVDSGINIVFPLMRSDVRINKRIPGRWTMGDDKNYKRTSHVIRTIEALNLAEASNFIILLTRIWFDSSLTIDERGDFFMNYCGSSVFNSFIGTTATISFTTRYEIVFERFGGLRNRESSTDVMFIVACDKPRLTYSLFQSLMLSFKEKSIQLPDGTEVFSQGELRNPEATIIWEFLK